MLPHFFRFSLVFHLKEYLNVFQAGIREHASKKLFALIGKVLMALVPRNSRGAKLLIMQNLNSILSCT